MTVKLKNIMEMPEKKLKRIHKNLIFFLFFIQSTIILSENNILKEHAANRAAYYCNRSIEEYNRDNFALSDHFLKRCEYNNAEYFYASSDILKLKAILLLRKNDFTNFIEIGKKSTALKKDPFFSFLLADAAMKTRRYSDAFNLLHDTLNSGNTISESNNDSLNMEGIFYCSLPNSKLKKIPLEPAKLSEINISIVKFQITALNRIIKKEKSNMGTTLENYPEGLEKKNIILLDLIHNPNSDINHLRCIHNLKKDIALKKKEMSGYMRMEANSVLLLLHKNRIAFNTDNEALFSYGSELLDSGAYREALHTFRILLEKTGWPVRKDKSFPDQNISEIFRKIGFTYARLNLKQDSRTMDRMAETINMYKSKSSPVFPDRELLNIAGENLHNREALLLLAEDARQRNNGKYEEYKNRIIERDKKMEEIEMNRFYGNNFPF